MNYWSRKDENEALDNVPSSVWEHPRLMTPEQLLAKMLPGERAQFPAPADCSPHLPIATEQLCVLLEDFCPDHDSSGYDHDLVRLFVHLCRAVFPGRGLVTPDRDMLNRLVDFACRNGLCTPTSPERFRLSVKASLIAFHKVFPALDRDTAGWTPHIFVRNKVSVYRGNCLREEFWDYVILGAAN